MAEENSPPGTPSVPSGPISGTSGNYYTYSTIAADPDGDRVKYTFDWGDGNPYTTPLVNQGTTVPWFHSWTVASGTPQTFSVSARATDEHGAVSSWSSPLSVTITCPTSWNRPQQDVNDPPATPSVPTGSTSGSSGTYYRYSTKATDPDGDDVLYTFDWGDGTTSVTSLVSSGTSASASHKWTVASGSSKTFSVRAKAEDESGTDSSWSSSLTVTITGPALVNAPPATPSVPSGSTSGSSGRSYSYSTKATDPDGDDVKYTFYWGDGTTSVTSLVSSGSSASASHIWTVASESTKTFSVSAKATDENGAVSSGSSPLSVTITGPAPVNDPPATPSVPTGSTSGTSGKFYSYSTKATDPDGDDVLYTFDWGDGTTSVTSLVSSGTSASASHKWTVASESTKTFSVRAKAKDESGTDSSWSSTLSVSISGPAPVNDPPATPSVPSGSTSGSSGTYYRYSTKATDPDGDDVLYTFDWGDGTTSVTSLVSSGTSASASHKWTVASGSTKTFSVRAKAEDESGTDSSWSSTLSVTITGTVDGGDANRPPGTAYVPWGPIVGKTEYSYTYETMATDPDGHRVKYLFDWGDGTSSTTGLVASGTWAKATHQWTVTAGTSKGYDITAKAIDEYGMVGASSIPTHVIIVAKWINHPPTVPSITGPSSGMSGVPIEFLFTSTDPDGDNVKYAIYWGDRLTETGYFPSGQPAKISHTWNVPEGQTKTYNIKAMAEDAYGMPCIEAWSIPVTIRIGPSIRAQELGLEVEGNEAIYVDTEEANSIDTQTNESESLDALLEENESLDALPEENESMDALPEENESLDALPEENESMDALLEENESIDALPEENESIDAQTGEDDSTDALPEEGCNFAEDDSYTMASNGSVLKISAPGVLENDQNGADKSLSVLSHTQPAHAADFSMNPDGSFTYTSSQDYCGLDSFTYTIDGDCESTEATVTIFNDCGLQNEEEVSLSQIPV